MPAPATSDSPVHLVRRAEAAVFRVLLLLASALMGSHATRGVVRAKLLVTVLVLGTLPLLIALYILPVQVQRTLTRQGHNYLRQVAQDLVNLTHNEMQRHLETARSLAQVDAIATAVLRRHAGELDAKGLASANRQISALLRGLAAHHYQGIFLADADGHTFAGALRDGPANAYAAIDINDRAYFSAVRNLRQPVVSNPLHSKIGGVPIVVVAVPILDSKGEFVGLLGLSVELGHLAGVISSQHLGETGYPFAIDRQGLLVIHPDPARAFKQRVEDVPGALTLGMKMQRGESGVEAYVLNDGARKIAAFAPEPLSGWSIAASIEEAEFSGPAQRMRLIILALIVACVVAAAVLAAIFAAGLERLNRSLAEVRASELKLAQQAALLDQTNDGILVCDLEGVIRFWNRGAERLYGWTAEEAIGRRLHELLHIDEHLVRAGIEGVLHTGSWFGHVEKKTRSGKVRVLDCSWTLLRDEHGSPQSILTTDTDITERREMESKFLRAQRMESIGTLAGGIAHDLNNLLSPIVVGLDLLKSSPRSAEDHRIFNLMGQASTRATALVRQVLSFARGEEGARVSVHIRYVAREVAAIVQSTFPRNITFRLDCAKDLWLVHADPTQLNQVILNLCVNARDAMPEGGQLTLAARNVELDEQFSGINHHIAPGRYVVVEVADTGTGIPREIIEKIFDPFFTTKERGKGTGLGLSTVLGITRAHGGAVNVYSEPGHGSVFKIYLPASTAALASDPVANETAAPFSGDGKTILLVEDEDMIRDVTRRALEFAGYSVITANDGAQGFALFHRHREEIDLVLTDMMMPIMDGAALVAALRRIDPQIVVIAASGLNDNNNQIKAAQAGISHFLCKPYTTASLLAAIARATGQPQL
ncbi:MAG: response regulator [Candidatus Didemnitutus sp.]|nr:response regulator [Candidatus Didemnitutus sp.]